MGPGRGVRGGVERWRGVGPFAAQGLRAPVTDGWPLCWVAVATRSVVRLIRSVDSVAEIKQHCGRWRDEWSARARTGAMGLRLHQFWSLISFAKTDIFRPNSSIALILRYATPVNCKKTKLLALCIQNCLGKAVKQNPEHHGTLKSSTQITAEWIYRLYKISDTDMIYDTDICKSDVASSLTCLACHITFHLFIRNVSC